MSPVCFVTERLYPVDSIDDWALEVAWRAREEVSAGSAAIVLWVTIAPPEQEVLNRARAFYTALGVELLLKEDLTPAGEPDEPLRRNTSGVNGLLAMALLRKLHSERKLARIEIAAERGLALRVVQAQHTGLAFEDMDVIVNLGHFGEWHRHHQMRLTVRPSEVRMDFVERESVELAQYATTHQAEKVAFIGELGWLPNKLQLRSLSPLPPPKGPPVGTRSVPCLFGDFEEDPGFEHFRLLVESIPSIPRWLLVEEARNRPGFDARKHQLEAAARKSGVQVICRQCPGWANFARILRDRNSFAILTHTAPGSRLRWLVQESIPFVFPESLREILPPTARAVAGGLGYAPHDPRSLLLALKNAAGFDQWPQVLSAWNEALRSIHTGESPRSLFHSRPVNPAIEEAPRQPRVTIAVSHFNLKQLLAETLECLEAQTYPACDVVVVDDGSDDPESLHAWAAAKQRFPAFSFVDLPHRGYWSPRNHAIKECKNPFIIIVDGDNLPRPEMAEMFVRAMQRNPEFAAFTSYIAAFSEDRQAAIRGEFQALNAPLGGDPVSGYFQNVYGDTNSIFRTEALQAIHGFREDFRCAFGDWELFHRLVGQGHKLGVIPKVLLHYRRRAGGMIRQRTLYREHWEFFQALDMPVTLRTADRRRFGMALHGLTHGQ